MKKASMLYINIYKLIFQRPKLFLSILKKNNTSRIQIA